MVEGWEGGKEGRREDLRFDACSRRFEMPLTIDQKAR